MPETEENMEASRKEEVRKEVARKEEVLGRESLLEEFNTAAYLRDFYMCIDDPAMQMILLFLPNIVQRIPPVNTLLDFGAGPTIHVATAFRNKAENIYLADYLPQNRQELMRWKNGATDFDWSEPLKKIATVEGFDWLHIGEMERKTRSKVRGVFHCDCHKNPSINIPPHMNLMNNFDVVTTIFCIEYCSNTLEEYKNAIRNVVDQIKPGGFFVMGGVLEETWCSFGGRKFSCLYVTEEELMDSLKQSGLMVDDSKETFCYNVNGMFLICSRKVV